VRRIQLRIYPKILYRHPKSAGAGFAKLKKQTPSFLKSTLRGGSAQIRHEKFKKLGELGAFLTCTCSAGASVASWR
jgi:hypothetical protein